MAAPRPWRSSALDSIVERPSSWFNAANKILPASSIYFQDSTTAFATFDLTSKAPGTLTLQATGSDGVTTTSAVGLEVLDFSAAPIAVPAAPS